MPGSFITVETGAGEPILAGGLTIVPFARSVRIHPAGVPVGLIWNSPAALAIQGGDGPDRKLPMRDVTRRVQLALLGAGLAGSLLIWLTFRRKSYG